MSALLDPFHEMNSANHRSDTPRVSKQITLAELAPTLVTASNARELDRQMISPRIDTAHVRIVFLCLTGRKGLSNTFIAMWNAWLHLSTLVPTVTAVMHVFCQGGNLRQSAIDAGRDKDDACWVDFYAKYGSSFTCPTEWGSPSLVYANQILLTEARSLYPSAQVFYLVSESCIPIVAPTSLQYHSTAFQTRFVPFQKNAERVAQECKLTAVDFFGGATNAMLEFQQNSGSKRSKHGSGSKKIGHVDSLAPTTPLCFHMQWHSISAPDADLIIGHTDWSKFCTLQLKFKSQYTIMLSPDEWFMGTALNVCRRQMAASFHNNPDPTTLLIDDDGDHPRLWTDFTTKHDIKLPGDTLVRHVHVSANLGQVINQYGYRLYSTCVFMRKVAPHVDVLGARVIDWTRQLPVSN